MREQGRRPCRRAQARLRTPFTGQHVAEPASASYLTTGRAVHDAHLLELLGRPAAVSVMKIMPESDAVPQLRGREFLAREHPISRWKLHQADLRPKPDRRPSLLRDRQPSGRRDLRSRPFRCRRAHRLLHLEAGTSGKPDSFVRRSCDRGRGDRDPASSRRAHLSAEAIDGGSGEDGARTEGKRGPCSSSGFPRRADRIAEPGAVRGSAEPRHRPHAGGRAHRGDDARSRPLQACQRYARASCGRQPDPRIFHSAGEASRRARHGHTAGWRRIRHPACCRVAGTNSAERLCERILAVALQPYDVLGNQVFVGTSIGLVLAPDGGRRTASSFCARRTSRSTAPRRRGGTASGPLRRRWTRPSMCAGSSRRSFASRSMPMTGSKWPTSRRSQRAVRSSASRR